MNVMDFIKKHPYGIAGAVLAIGILFIYERSASNGSSGAASIDSALIDQQNQEAAAAASLQQAQLQAQTQTNQINAEASVANQQTAGQVTVAQLEAQTSQNNNTINDQTSEQIAALSAQVADTQSSLQAAVANAQTQAAVDEQQIQANAYTTLNAQNTNAEIAIASLPYQGNASSTQIAALEAAETNTSVELSNLPGYIGITPSSNFNNLVTQAAQNISTLQAATYPINEGTGGLATVST